MKLDRLHEYVLTTVALCIGLAAAVYCGKMTGGGQTNTVAVVLMGFMATVAALAFRTYVWMALPLAWHFTGQIPILPIPAAARDIVILTVFGMFLAFLALKLVRTKPKWQALDIWLLVNLLYVASEFIRNPVGSVAMGSDRVGGRPYFTIFTATLAYWVLARVVCPPRGASKLPVGMVALIWVESGLMLLCAHFWWLAGILGNFYSAFAQDTRLTAADIAGLPQGDSRDARQTALNAPGLALGQLLAAYFRPLSFAIPFPLHIFRKLGLLLTVGLIFASGFRSILFAVIFGFLVSGFFQRGWTEVLRIALFGGCALMLLGITQGTIINLPLPAQRALSFLPGHWDTTARLDAEESTNWRVEMWKDALFTDKYIENKLFGDGFGVSASQMHRVMMLQALPSLTREQGQASAAIVSNFHSGPVSTIKYAGYVGMLLFYFLLYQTAMIAVRIIRRALHTPYQALALFVGIPLIIRPFFFTFIFGAYGDDLPETIFGIGMLKMLDTSLAADAQAPPAIGHRTITAAGRRQRPTFAPVAVRMSHIDAPGS